MGIIPITRKRRPALVKRRTAHTPKSSTVLGPPTLLRSAPLDPTMRQMVVEKIASLLPEGFSVGVPANPFADLSIMHSGLDEAIAWVATPSLPSIGSLGATFPVRGFMDERYSPLELLALAEFALDEGVAQFVDTRDAPLTGELREKFFRVMQAWGMQNSVDFMATITDDGQFVFSTTRAAALSSLYSPKIRVAKLEGNPASPKRVSVALSFMMSPSYPKHLLSDDDVAAELKKVTDMWRAWATSPIPSTSWREN